MERNTFWKGPEPAIDEIVYRIYKNDDAIATALQTGEIDFAHILTPNIFNTLKTAENIDTMVGSDPVVLRDRDEHGFGLPGTGGRLQAARRRPPRAHGRGRTAAIRMAIDSEALNEQVMLGYGVPGDSIIPPVSVAGARWEPTGDDKLGPGHRGCQTAPRGCRLRRLGRRRRPRDARRLGGPGTAARFPLLRADPASRPRSTPLPSCPSGSRRSGSRPRSPR